MTATEAPVGLPAGGRPINLSQLEAEINAQGVALQGLGMIDDWIFKYADGAPADFSPADTPIVQQAINAHVAMRDKTTQELAAEFQASGTTAARKQEIRDMQNGLAPMEQVAVTQEEWDAQTKVPM